LLNYHNEGPVPAASNHLLRLFVHFLLFFQFFFSSFLCSPFYDIVTRSSDAIDKVKKESEAEIVRLKSEYDAEIARMKAEKEAEIARAKAETSAMLTALKSALDEVRRLI
jgi:hypothetical protein